MYIEVLKIAFATLGVLVLLLVIAVAIRSKSIGMGLIAFFALLLFFTPFAGGIGLLYWYSRNISEETQITIGMVALICGILSLNLFMQGEAYRIKKVGSTSPSNRTGNAKIWRGVMGFIVLYCFLTMVSDLFYETDVNESIRRNTVWWVLAVWLLIYLYFSFEFREKGFVYRGKVILLSEIAYAEWENPRNKTKLKIKLIKKDREIMIKTPWEINIQIDNYLRANFPRP
jgi:hypothetical protein